MAVCKYFLQNRCRYGNACRFEHDQGGGVQRQLRFDNGGGGRDSNRFKWTAQNNNNNTGEAQNNPEEIVSGLRSNLETWEQSKMWPFSCMALEKDHPCMPEFNDLSADELRWEAYQAIKGGGNLMAYTEKVKQLTEEYRNKRQLLKHPTSDIKNQLIQFINNYRQNKNTDAKSSFVKPSAFGSPGSSSSGAFGNMSSTATAASSGFGGQASSNNIFGNQSSFGTQPANSGSVFGNQSSFGQTSTFGTNSFGSHSNDTFGSQSNAGSIFSNAAKSSGFGNNSNSGSALGQTATFGQTASSGSIFGQSSTPSSGSTPGFGQSGSTAFGQQTLSNSGFGQTQQPQGQGQNPARNLFTSSSSASAFGNSAAPSGSTSAFGNSAAPSGSFGIQGQTTNVNTKSTVYTPIDQLTADEKAQFEADHFTPGRIPVKPPPRELIK